MSEAQSKIAVVLGGGNGIGAACCHLMAKRGWRVAVADLDQASADSVAKEVEGRGYAIDVSDSAAIDRFSQTVETDLGPVSGLVVSSGAFQERSSPADLPLDVLRRLVDVNVSGTFYANRSFGTRMAKRGGGSIVNIGSTSGYSSTPLYIYGATKAAVINLSKNLAVEWARSGVRVNSVSPGHVMVPRKLKRPPGRYATDLNSYIALGRHIEPAEIAEGVEFLLSDKASAITGIDLLIDAGMIASSTWGLYGGVPGPINKTNGE